MRGALLRSGKSGSFTALGETGQPVYRAALQLREAIRRKNPEMVDHLAIPQSDELGNQIDWYSGLEGDVIPWSSATEEERVPARLQLESLKTALDELSQRYLGTDPAEQQQGDKAVFGKLLKRVIHFPDENFVYLVQGKPVLTFWGFEHAGTDRNRDPLHCLTQAAPVFTLPPVVEAAPVVAPIVPVVARPWWRRWWWLLLLPFLLLLLWLLLGLRGCVPIPRVAVDLLPEGVVPVERQLEEPPLTGNATTLNGVPVTGTVTGTTTGTAVTGTHGVEATAVEGNEADAASADLGKDLGKDPGKDQGNDPAKDPAAESPATAPENKTAPPAVTSPEAEKPAAAKAGPPLSIPPDAADGAAKFLDGQFRAGAGIQDRRTGKPLRLEYQLKDGKGEVTVHQADGTKCSGPVSATMKGGSLAIDSQGQAVCADGSTYDMPKVNCRKGATTVADCTGGYGKEQFPMSMRHVAE
ncbi:SrfA family protein [Pseudomonas sp. A-B-26]|uniref:SrfA family protein n=1 Tax=Pseudomonas sp. A-B-26 TaxID=2832406 RepID=UPI001CBE0BAD|nr:SrfA family protein [Pseudomonas sp. A-B-26]